MHPTRAVTTILATALTAGVLAACGTGAGGQNGQPAGQQTGDQTAAAGGDGSLVIYSGRNEKLVGPLLNKLEQAVGTKVEVRYGDSSSMAAQLLEEGENTPADLFFSQDAGALGALAKQNRLAQLDEQTTGKVLDGYADDDNRWVATSARARVIAYNPQKAAQIASATSIDAVLDPKYKGKIGYAPTNASWHSFVTALRVAKGEDGARDWLTKFKVQQPKAYEKNTTVLEGVETGEVDLGLINHYYWYQRVAEQGADGVTSKIRFLDSTDPGALINVAGVGVVAGSDQSEAATKAVNFLLGQEAQTYFADETAEYPVVEGVSSGTHELPRLNTLNRPPIDLNDLDSLPQTLELLGQVGLS